MADPRTNIHIAASVVRDGNVDDYAIISLLQQIADNLNGVWAENTAQLTTAISNPPTQAEVVEIGNKVNEIITALVNAGVMDPEP